MKFYLRQFKLYRQLKGGCWHFIMNDITSGFWVEKDKFKHCCGSYVAAIECY